MAKNSTETFSFCLEVHIKNVNGFTVTHCFCPRPLLCMSTAGADYSIIALTQCRGCSSNLFTPINFCGTSVISLAMTSRHLSWRLKKVLAVGGGGWGEFYVPSTSKRRSLAAAGFIDT